jgi:hypothetical protein
MECTHHTAAAHLLRHLRWNVRASGVTCCADVLQAPVTELLASVGATSTSPSQSCLPIPLGKIAQTQVAAPDAT